MSLNEQLISLYQQLYEHTRPECALSCRVPLSCCSPEYCDLAALIAKEQWNVDLSALQQQDSGLKFMGAKGCVVPPHLRPHCTMHTCDINGFGFKMRPAPDENWTQRYFDLRSQIEELEWQRDESRTNQNIEAGGSVEDHGESI